MDLVCIGVNHRTCPVDIREQLAFSEFEQPQALSMLKQRDDIRESFLLSTCNRVELYARGHYETEAKLIQFLTEYHELNESTFSPYLYRYRGSEVVEHMFRVTSGLDSLVIGENEIYGQVRNAFRLAHQLKALDSILYQVVERAIRVGKRVRAETMINERAVSVSSIAVDLAQKIFGELDGKRVLVIGTGKMSEQTMTYLVARGAEKITVASRTYERALEVSQKFGATPIGFDEWFRAMKETDIVISSTAAPQPIIRVDDVAQVMRERRQKPLCFIDIAVPRDIDPRAGEIDDVYLYDIDDLRSVSEENLKLREKEVRACERLIERELNSFDQWYRCLEAKPVIQKLISYFENVVEEELLRSRYKFKGKEKEIDELLRKMKARLLHMPLEQLKQAAKEGSVERHLDTIHTLFKLDDRQKKNVSQFSSESYQTEKIPAE